MKKGFTLIELLIVMVVVGILVTVALPKYKTALEKGRGLEGVANAAAVSEAINAYYVKNGNSYGSAADVRAFAEVAGITQTKNFNAPVLSGTTVKVQRSTGSYTIVFENANGEVSSRYCTGNVKFCKALGASKNASGGSCTASPCYF